MKILGNNTSEFIHEKYNNYVYIFFDKNFYHIDYLVRKFVRIAISNKLNNRMVRIKNFLK